MIFTKHFENVNDVTMKGKLNSVAFSPQANYTKLLLSKTPSCFYLKTHFGDWIVFIFRFNLHSWAQSIELVIISGQLYQH
jgi:hypothetical protein